MRIVKGYRGDGSEFGQRGLPTYNAQMLVNFAESKPAALYLDPFAGIGCIILEEKARGFQTVILDFDPKLWFGLQRIRESHVIGICAYIPFLDCTFDGIATEPPFYKNFASLLYRILKEKEWVLDYGGKLSKLCATCQVEEVRK